MDKANRILFDMICIVAIIIFPLWILRMIGIERWVLEHDREKQIPKKPFIYTNDKGRLACCPVCDSNVDWTYEGFWRKGNPKYCKDCGQIIDWSK